jgi:hypothetical protein
MKPTHVINNIVNSDFFPIDFQRKDQHYIVKHENTLRYQNTTIQVQNPVIHNFHEFLRPNTWTPLIRNLLNVNKNLILMDPHTKLLIHCDGGVKNNNLGFGVAVTIH